LVLLHFAGNASIAAIVVITASGLATMVSRRGKSLDGMGYNVQNTGALARIIHDGSSRNHVPKHVSDFEFRVSSFWGMYPHNLKPETRNPQLRSSPAQRIRDCSRSAHE
jgi:hypothetical protein